MAYRTGINYTAGQNAEMLECIPARLRVPPLQWIEEDPPKNGS
jgi:hypothetical protein